MTKIAGRYEIKAKLGEGGMGVVFRAYDPAPMDREVAVKTLHESRIRSRASCSTRNARPSSPSAIRTSSRSSTSASTSEGGHKRPFFVMPLLPGQTLDALIRKASHRLTVDRVVEIFAQTCRGLQAAHERGLVHRDLKPSNIFVMDDDSVKIIDFGVAHAANEQSRSGYDKGTLLYMAPEQVQHKPVSVQSDIYSLGVTLYEALTRRQPFRSATEDSIVQAILKQIPPPASDLNPAVSHVISRVVHKAMAKQPWNRFDSARELGDTLQKAYRNEPIALFDPARTQPRIQTATKALEKGDSPVRGRDRLRARGRGQHRSADHAAARADRPDRASEDGRATARKRPRAVPKKRRIRSRSRRSRKSCSSIRPTSARSASRARSRIGASEHQIEKWIQLAQQHSSNRLVRPRPRGAPERARAARQGTARLAAPQGEFESEETGGRAAAAREDRAGTRRAVNAWQNGEVSQALSQMKLVLELGPPGPDHVVARRGRHVSELLQQDTTRARRHEQRLRGSGRHLAEKQFDKARRSAATSSRGTRGRRCSRRSSSTSRSNTPAALRLHRRHGSAPRRRGDLDVKSVLREDVDMEKQLIVGKSHSGKVVDLIPRAYPGLSRVVENNILYIANLIALEQWYLHVRKMFFEHQEFGHLIFTAILENLRDSQRGEAEAAQGYGSQNACIL